MALQWTLQMFVFVILVTIIEGRPKNRHLGYNEEHEIKIENTEEDIPTEFEYQMPVHHFARHILCLDRSGMIAFHHAMSRKLSTLNGGFLESFVFDLCRLHSRNDSILDRWVKELFDTDRSSKSDIVLEWVKDLREFLCEAEVAKNCEKGYTTYGKTVTVTLLKQRCITSIEDIFRLTLKMTTKESCRNICWTVIICLPSIGPYDMCFDPDQFASYRQSNIDCLMI